MNPVVHFELPYEDPARATAFYSKAFNWNLQQLGAEMNNYIVAHTTETDENSMVQTPGAINGGLYPKSEDPNTQSPSIVISVQDINTAIENITAAGGVMLTEPMMIPGIGEFASFKDTEGNRLSVLQPLMK
jgi:uncharacterized protein